MFRRRHLETNASLGKAIQRESAIRIRRGPPAEGVFVLNGDVQHLKLGGRITDARVRNRQSGARIREPPADGAAALQGNRPDVVGACGSQRNAVEPPCMARRIKSETSNAPDQTNPQATAGPFERVNLRGFSPLIGRQRENVEWGAARINHSAFEGYRWVIGIRLLRRLRDDCVLCAPRRRASQARHANRNQNSRYGVQHRSHSVPMLLTT